MGSDSTGSVSCFSSPTSSIMQIVPDFPGQDVQLIDVPLELFDYVQCTKGATVSRSSLGTDLNMGGGCGSSQLKNMPCGSLANHMSASTDCGTSYQGPLHLSQDCCASILPSASQAFDPSVNSSTPDGETWVLERMNTLPTKAWPLPDAPACEFCGAKRFHREPSGFCCSNGRVSFALPKIPMDLWSLFIDDTDMAIEFRRLVRTYNNSFAFTSLSMKYDPNYCWANQGVYTIRVCGQIYHFMASLKSTEGVGCNVQLYFYGDEEEFKHRLDSNK